MKRDFILTAEGVSKSFDGFKAIDDLNFYLDKGELRARSSARMAPERARSWI